jgi:hypothetical protein
LSSFICPTIDGKPYSVHADSGLLSYITYRDSNCVSRQHCIQELLIRSFGIYTDSTIADMEAFLEQNLHLSPLLIHKAKAIFSRYCGRKEIELKYLMLANEFDAAFDLFTSHLAGSIILKGKLMPCLMWVIESIRW